MRTGQAALEFLVTYGWAILAILGAIGALSYFGVLDPQQFIPESCTASPGFSCLEYKVEQNGVSHSRMFLWFKQSVSTTISIYDEDIFATDADFARSTSVTNLDNGKVCYCEMHTNDTAQIMQNKRYRLVCQMDGDRGPGINDCFGTSAWLGNYVGERVRLEVNIPYIGADDAYMKAASFKLNAPVLTN